MASGNIQIGFEGPAGATGAQGPAGADGAQGPAGADGADTGFNLLNILNPETGLQNVASTTTQTISFTAGKGIRLVLDENVVTINQGHHYLSVLVGGDISINSDICDLVDIALGANENLTITGTPYDNQPLTIRIFQGATGNNQPIWDANKILFGADILAADTLSGVGLVDIFGLRYFGPFSKWLVVARSRGFNNPA